MVADDRAQLVLVGAIAIAIVLIAMTTVLNSAVFTENVARGNSVEVSGDVEEFDRETVRNVRSLVIRVTHRTEYTTAGGNGEDDLKADVRENVSDYSRILTESYADTGSVFVNVTHEDTTIGQRLLQDQDDDFARNDGQPTWTPIDDPFQLGWFVVNVDIENTSQSSPVYLELTDAAGSELNVSMRRTVDGDLAVHSEIDGGSVSDVTCDPRNGRVLVDVLEGTTYTGDCTFNSTEHLEPTYSEFRIVHGDNAQGKYDFVVNRSDGGSINGAPSCDSVEEPCRSIAVWSVNLTTHYQTGAVGYEKAHVVEVYDG